MRSSKPTIVLVPGAWYSPQHYAPLLHEFSKAGYTVVSQQLPSVNPAVPTSASVANDTMFIRHQLLIPLLEGGKEVLLITHSYGSVPGAAAAAGLSRQQRQAQGSEGGLLGLVVIAGLLIGQGETLFNLFGGRFQPWHLVNVRAGDSSAAQLACHVQLAPVSMSLSSEHCLAPALASRRIHSW